MQQVHSIDVNRPSRFHFACRRMSKHPTSAAPLDLPPLPTFEVKVQLYRVLMIAITWSRASVVVVVANAYLFYCTQLLFLNARAPVTCTRVCVNICSACTHFASDPGHHVISTRKIRKAFSCPRLTPALRYRST